MYEAIRDTFARKPAGGWPLNYGPRDVGLGPYDFTDMDVPPRTSWDFSDGAQGWGTMMGISEFKAAAGAISFVTASRDPAIACNPQPFRADRFSKLVIRIKYEAPAGGKDNAQLFWNVGNGTSEELSAHADVPMDGQWHDVTLDLQANARWRGKVVQLRFDPCSTQGVKVTIEEMRLE